jgi:hypothetical protein
MSEPVEVAGGGDRIRRRLVLYVHGFDPRGPGTYYAMQVEDAARETARPDRTLSVGPRRRQGGLSAWTLSAVWPEGAVETEFVTLRWDDLVRARWDRSLRAQFAGLIEWWRVYRAKGITADAARTSRTILIAILATPVTIAAFVASLLLILTLAAVILGTVAAKLGLPAWLGALAYLGLAGGPRLWRRLDARINLCWLSRGFLHTVEAAQGRIEGLDARLDAFADHLIQAAQDPAWDEIVVVGHSSGSIHAPVLIGRALSRRPELGREGPRVALITVGHCLPVVSKQGVSPALAADLARLVAARHIGWMDITAASDPGAAAGWRPLKDSSHAADETRVTCRSPRFHRAMAPAAYRRLKREPMALHFQYMRSSDHPEVYDWFRLIAGSEPIAR